MSTVTIIFLALWVLCTEIRVQLLWSKDYPRGIYQVENDDQLAMRAAREARDA